MDRKHFAPQRQRENELIEKVTRSEKYALAGKYRKLASSKEEVGAGFGPNPIPLIFDVLLADRVIAPDRKLGGASVAERSRAQEAPRPFLPGDFAQGGLA